jgi:hypothetical protein
MRLLGREALQGWADKRVEATEREIRQQPGTGAGYDEGENARLRPGPYPDAYGDKPGHDGITTADSSQGENALMSEGCGRGMAPADEAAARSLRFADACPGITIAPRQVHFNIIEADDLIRPVQRCPERERETLLAERPTVIAIEGHRYGRLSGDIHGRAVHTYGCDRHIAELPDHRSSRESNQIAWHVLA